MKTDRVQLRITEFEKEKWESAAAERGMSLSEYIRLVVNIAVEKNA